MNYFEKKIDHGILKYSDINIYGRYRSERRRGGWTRITETKILNEKEIGRKKSNFSDGPRGRAQLEKSVY